jgi:hypothetical protein
MGRGSKPAELIGTQSADRIRASGHARRVEQAGHMSAPDRADLSERNPLRGGRSLIAAPPSRLSLHRLPGSRFSPRSARAAATSGPGKRRHCKVHNGLTLDECPRPRPRNCLHPRPGATRLSVSCGRVSMRYAAIVCGVQRNGSPDRQTLCRITDNLRAKATRALPGPERCSMAAAQSFRCSDRLIR